jgi:hypothetical protein
MLAAALRARYIYRQFGLRRELDTYLNFYNHDRIHHGRLTRGRIPADIVYAARKMEARCAALSERPESAQRRFAATTETRACSERLRVCAEGAAQIRDVQHVLASIAELFKLTRPRGRPVSSENRSSRRTATVTRHRVLGLELVAASEERAPARGQRALGMIGTGSRVPRARRTRVTVSSRCLETARVGQVNPSLPIRETL